MLQQQLDELGADEGIRMLVYDDATGRPIGPGTLVRGHPTIGIGRALDVHGITAAEAHYFLANDIAAVEAALSRLEWYQELDPVRRGVCTNLAFNMGVRGLQSFVGMISDIEAAEHDLTGAMQQLAQGQFDAAADELARSDWAKQVQPSRRDRLLMQLRTGRLDAEVAARRDDHPGPKPTA